MRLRPAVTWTFDVDSGRSGGALDPRLIPLLEAIAATGSLAAAVDVRDLSYRAGWGLLREHARRFGVPLVEFERGRGARLGHAGARLLDAKLDAQRELARVLSELRVDIGSSHAPRRAAASPLVVVASHDLALAALRELAPPDPQLRLDISFMGSLHALMQFAEGRADVAGFHVALGAKAAELAPFRRWLDARRDRLIDFVEREQGLMVPSGNPSRVRGFRDIAIKRLRFVNRQSGSGTRLLIERLMIDAGIDAALLKGFSHEEFTHPAIAATVASGAADVGFGLRAAAAERGLAFVPLLKERYCLAVRADDCESARLAPLLRTLRGAHFADLVAALPGYATPHAGRVGRVTSLAREPRTGPH
ncbi:MAG: substrate-binding domain-containing protein [Betaproteobacteria bacterium]